MKSLDALLSIGEQVNRRIVEAASAYGIANVTEWCKRERCWEDLKLRIDTSALDALQMDLVSSEAASSSKRSARKEQKVTNEVEAQTLVLNRGAGLLAKAAQVVGGRHADDAIGTRSPEVRSPHASCNSKWRPGRQAATGGGESGRCGLVSLTDVGDSFPLR